METGRLTIVIDDEDEFPLITAVGDLDAASTPGASGYIARRVAAAPTSDWLFDLAGAEFVDSSGLQLLLIVQHEIAPGGSLTLLNPSPALRRLFALVGLEDRFATRTDGLSINLTTQPGSWERGRRSRLARIDRIPDS